MTKVVKLTENQFGEMMAYHGSGANFDKFNHKKYLNTGAGSQSFGWGTYVTTDIAIGESYAKDIEREESYGYESAVYEGLVKYGMSEMDIISCYDDVCETLIEYLDNYGYKDALYSIKDSVKYCTDKKRVIKYKAMLYALKNKPEKSSYLYEVEIPDDNGFNYLSWYDEVTDEQLDIIYDKLIEYGRRYNIIKIDDIIEHFYKVPDKGESIYYSLFLFFRGMKIYKAEKAASLFLMQCGLDGIKYPAGTRWQKPDGAAEDAYNYVIFDTNKVKIINKTKV